MKARAYQKRTIEAVEQHWAQGARSVLVVAPTGAGKTHIGSQLIAARRTLWVAHTRELVLQAEEKFRRVGVGVMMAGKRADERARIQVGTVQTLLARGLRPEADLIVLDEAHHYLAEEWRELRDAYPRALCLGLTATPARQDGEALGDMFEHLVVAASYSELVRDGYLVPARVLRPPTELGNDLAQDPLDAWLAHGDGSLTFGFAGRVAIAEANAQRFRDHGFLSEVIHAGTAKRDRDEVLARFRARRTLALWNVNTMTEGVDVPEARCAILARSFGHIGGFIQATGRVLRPAEGKRDAIIIDLCGSTHAHGLPTEDRVYSLKGRAISSVATPHGGGVATFTQEVVGAPLVVAAHGAGTPTAQAKPTPIDDGERRAEYQRLLALARQHRMRDGFAAAKYREKFGEEPRSGWA